MRVSEMSVDLDPHSHDKELAELIVRTANGDEEALGALYDQTSPQVFGLALWVLDDPAAAEEVTLDVYMQVWRKARQFDQERGKPIVWLAVLTRSRAIDRLRVGKAERASHEPFNNIEASCDPLADPEVQSVKSEQRNLVQQALGSLSPEQREVIELAYFWGYSQSEIAEKVGEPLGTVKTRIRLGMIKLRNYLGPFQEGLAS